MGDLCDIFITTTNHSDVTSINNIEVFRNFPGNSYIQQCENHLFAKQIDI